MTDFRGRRLSGKPDVKVLLVIGALTHLFFVSLLFLAGRSQVFPKYLLKNGTLAGDASSYLENITVMSQLMTSGNFDSLFSGVQQFHIRLFAISHALLSPLVGGNIFALELVNLPLLLGILYLTYKIGELCFSRRVGFWAALVVSFLPSFQVHAAQPLRDSLFIFLFLGFFLILALLLTRPLKLASAATFFLLSAACFVMLWVVRNGMFPVYLAITGSAFFLLVLARRKSWSDFKFNAVILLLLTGFVFLTPRTFANLTPEKRFYSVEMYEKIERFKSGLRESGQPKYLAYINAFRYEFNSVYADAGSNIDSDVYISSQTELLLYLPRAAMIGAFAPFPNLWLSEGKSFGRSGRIFAAIETFLIYILAGFALVAAYRNYRSVYFWLIALSFGLGVTALGLIVTNLGALYRMRYFFWFLLILLGVEGVMRCYPKITPADNAAGK